MTHYTDSDDARRTLVRALCGKLVINAEGRDIDLQHPTCPCCAAILAEREAEPLPAWAKAGLR
jgi:hypothetical protein